MRVEWFTGSDPGRSSVYLELEFRDPELNRPLSLQECTRLFTYQP